MTKHKICRTVLMGLWLGFMCPTLSAQTPPSEIVELYDASPKLIGEASFRFGVFKLYDSALWGENSSYNTDETYSLTLVYARRISSKAFTNVAIKELERTTGKPESNFEYLRDDFMKCFPPVKKNDRITAHKQSAEHVKVFYNHEAQCDLKGDNMADEFFGIWLSDRSRDAKKSRQLRGLKK